MIKEIKELYKKYDQMSKTSEYVDIGQVKQDIWWLVREARMKRIPKKDR